MLDIAVTHQASAPKLHDVTIVIKKPYECARVLGVPPEEFGIARSARNIKDAGYCYHEVLRLQSELIDEGYDPKQVGDLPTATIVTSIEAIGRDTVDEGRFASGGDHGMNTANRRIRVTEHYVRMDYEGDGKARLYRVVTGGETAEILRCQEIGRAHV